MGYENLSGSSIMPLGGKRLSDIMRDAAIQPQIKKLLDNLMFILQQRQKLIDGAPFEGEDKDIVAYGMPPQSGGKMEIVYEGRLSKVKGIGEDRLSHITRLTRQIYSEIGTYAMGCTLYNRFGEQICEQAGIAEYVDSLLTRNQSYPPSRQHAARDKTPR